MTTGKAAAIAGGAGAALLALCFGAYAYRDAACSVLWPAYSASPLGPMGAVVGFAGATLISLCVVLLLARSMEKP
jgi:hypothetical protein